MPVGFKTARMAAWRQRLTPCAPLRNPYRFAGINRAGQVGVIIKPAKPHGHVILRGGKAPNYSPADVASV